MRCWSFSYPRHRRAANAERSSEEKTSERIPRKAIPRFEPLNRSADWQSAVSRIGNPQRAGGEGPAEGEFEVAVLLLRQFELVDDANRRIRQRLVDVYHEFDHPFEMVKAMTRALKPGGRIVFVEFRAEDPKVSIKAVHKMTEAQVRKEMTVQPLAWEETIATLPQQHVIVFRKKP